ncbi:MAG: site-2 protease family protein [Oligoflexia bacterium]|nr:site-2 protease family protein [Oligoflexia bacterium]
MNNTRSFELNLVTVKGIPLKVHLTFLLLIAWVGFNAISNRQNVWIEISFVLLLFLLVALHELSHALSARVFGVQTRDIVLYPFGGIASLTGAVRPFAELTIALAGPAFNMAVATIMLLVSGHGDALELMAQEGLYGRIFGANLALAIFNLIPAIPMDGGRVLRAALQLLGLKSATWVACRLSQLISIGMGALGLFYDNPILLLIAVLVFTSAARELSFAHGAVVQIKGTAADVMSALGKLEALEHGSTVSGSLPQALRSLQTFFPVLVGQRLLGFVSRDAILNQSINPENDIYVSELMLKEFPQVKPQTPLAVVLQLLEQARVPFVAVTQEESLLGMIFRENLLDYLLVGSLRNLKRGTSPQ